MAHKVTWQVTYSRIVFDEDDSDPYTAALIEHDFNPAESVVETVQYVDDKKL